MMEFTRRLAKGGLAETVTGSLVTRALAMQADKTAAWTTPWGDFLQAAWSKGKLDDAQVATYIRNAPTLGVEIRPHALAGQRALLSLANTGSRVGATSDVFLSIEPPEVSIQGNSGQAELIHAVGGTMYARLRPQTTTSSRIQIAMPSEPGTYTLLAKYRLGAKLGYGGDNMPITSAWERVFTTTVDVVPPGTRIIDLLADETARAAIEAAIKATVVVRSPDPRGLRPVELRLDVESAPLPVAFDVFLRYPGPAGRFTETTAGQIAAPGGQVFGFGLNADLPVEFDADLIDIVLRPSPEAAHRTTFLTQIWNGEIVLADVPVRRAQQK